MSLPYHCDALLPQAERYASLRFRRLAQFIEMRLLSWEDCVELVAFVESIGGVKYAAYIFHWKGLALVRAYRHIAKHVGDAANEPIRLNRSQMGVDDGLAVLKSMQDGGWTHGTLPWIVKHALKDLRKRGMSIARIAKAVGLTNEQVKTACDVRTRAGRRERAAASAGLALG